MMQCTLNLEPYGLDLNKELNIMQKSGLACGNFLRRRLPIVTWLPFYSSSDLISDLVAGVTVGLTLIPQVIGYAALAGLEPQYGLYGGLMGGWVYLFLGTTPQLCVGPTALVCLLTFTYTQDTNVDMVILLTFLSGCVTLLLGVLQLGFLIEFVSGPVVSGFTSAAALTIASSQVKSLFGLRYNCDDFLSAWHQFFKHVHNTILTDLGLGLICITVLLLLRKVRDIKVPGGGTPSLSSPHWLSKGLWFVTNGRNAFVVLTCIVLSYVLEAQGDTPFTLSAHIQKGLPPFRLPATETTLNNDTLHLYQMIQRLGNGPIVMPFIQIISSIAIVKAFANGKCVDSTQEIIALGVCNILGSLVQSPPVAGSFTRAAVNDASGVRTELRGVFTSGVVILALEFITPYFHYIPRATLASVVICSVLFMVEWRVVLPMWHSNRRDLIPGMSSFLACLFLGVEEGLLVGVLVDICFLLYFNARPDVFVEKRTMKHTTGEEVNYWHVRPKGTLLFPAVDNLRQNVLSQTRDDSGVKMSGVVLDCSSIGRSDFSLAQGMQGIQSDLEKQGLSLILLLANPQVAKSLTGVCKDVKVANCEEELCDFLR